jgi:ATP-binding cassette subfamily B protein
MDSGEIIEQGTHDELMALKGSYFDLFEKQLLEEQTAG